MYIFYIKKLCTPPRGIAKLLLIMRLTTIILITAILQVSASSFAQRITLSEKNAPLVKIFDKIRQQSGVDFLVSTSMLKEAKPVTIQVNNAELNDVLKEIFDAQNLEFAINDKSVVVSKKEPSFLDKVKSRFFDISVSGVVLDSAGKALPGASVTVKGTLKAVTSGDAGQFFLSNVKEGSVLVISYIGYETQEIKAEAVNKILYVKMIPSSSKLQEVIVNAGYYTVKDSERTGSISRITSKEIERQPVSNILATMQGSMAGVNITQKNGIPGAGFQIEIRGRNSLNRTGNDPLYIVDGVPFPAQRIDDNIVNAGILGGSFGYSPLNGINPADIESIEILKDADATAIYGSRGANGVVLLTTRKGKAGKTAFSINAYTGASKVGRKLDLLNTQQYLEIRREAYANDNITPEFYIYDLVAWDQNRYTDWQKELIGGTAHTNNINAQVSGGNANTTFLMSGGYNQQGTVFPGDFKYKSGTAHLNLKHKSENQRFNLNLSADYAADKNNQTGYDLTANIFLSPNAPALYKENGELNWENSTWSNPFANLLVKYLGQNNRLSTRSTLNYKILTGLEFKIDMGFTDTRFTESIIIPHTYYDPINELTSAASMLTLNNAKLQSWDIEPQLVWNHQIAKGLLSVQIGATFLQNTSAKLVNSGSGFLSNAFINNITAATSQSVLATSNIDYRHNAVFGRINYNWDGKYIANLTGRRDGSSRFGPGKQFGNFGAVGLAWLFSKEAAAIQLMPFLSFGKLRVSYGITGSDAIGDYKFLNAYHLTGGNNYDGVTGLSPTQLYNPDFSWETNKKLEMAIDLGFFNDRIFFTGAYYRNRSSSQLVGMPLPGTTGFQSIQSNLNATVQNTGVELELRTVNLQRGLRWSTSFNVSIPRNKLISFPGLAGSTYASQYIVGQPLNVTQVYHYTGLNQQTGLYTFEDYNSDGVISGASARINDAYKVIDLSPKYFGGITNSLVYGNLELNFLFQFVKQTGSNIYSYLYMPGGSNQNVPVAILDRWQKPGDNKPFQRLATFNNNEAFTAADNLYYSDYIYSDASYIRLKNIALSYTLPKTIIKVANCRVYLQAQNLFTITKYNGIDPETQTASQLPTLKVITAGLQLNF